MSLNILLFYLKQKPLATYFVARGFKQWLPVACDNRTFLDEFIAFCYTEGAERLQECYKDLLE
jgi:hypothetical protein